MNLVVAAYRSSDPIAEADINSPDDIKNAMQALARSRVDVVIVLQTGCC